MCLHSVHRLCWVSRVIGDVGRSASTSAEEASPGRSSDKRTLAEQHRRNISLAIKQKWADPAYRMRASCSMRSGDVQHKRVSTARVSLPDALTHVQNHTYLWCAWMYAI